MTETVNYVPGSYPATDRRKRDAAEPFGRGDGEARGIAADQQGRLVLRLAAPDRAGRVDDMRSGQAIAACEPGLHGLAAPPSRRPQQIRPGRPVNGAVNAAVAGQGAVGGIDDGFDLKPVMSVLITDGR